MSLWWMWGTGSPTPSSGGAERNAPSLWSGGIRWDGDAPEAGYWQTSPSPTPRTGEPGVSVAIGGELVLSVVRSASWQLGRDEWLGTLAPATASLDVEGALSFDPMADVVIGLMSDVTDQHSASLWVGYAETLSETTDAAGHVTSSVACVDVIGRLGQSPAPRSGIPSWQVPTLAAHLAWIASEAGSPVGVVDDSVHASEVISFAFEDETALAAVNRLELATNANVLLRGDGRLLVARRYYAEDDLDPAPPTVALSGADAPSTWTVVRSPTSVVNDWGDAWASSAAKRASMARYGRRTSSAPDTAGWNQLVDETLNDGLMLSPRPTFTAEVPVTDLSHPALSLDPADWAAVGGTTYQVLAVRHRVEPGRPWVVSLSGDSTQPAFHEVFE